MTGGDHDFMGEGTELLQALVEIRSPSGFEGAAVDFLTSWMHRRGFDAYRDEAEEILDAWITVSE